MDSEQGWYANVVMPGLAVVALVGIDQIGTELENPFGDDANDIDVQELISTLERECLRMLQFAGDGSAREAFIWLPVPAYMQEETTRPWKWYLALKEEVTHLTVPRRRGECGLRVRHVTQLSAEAPALSSANRASLYRHRASRNPLATMPENPIAYS